jgi:integrase
MPIWNSTEACASFAAPNARNPPPTHEQITVFFSNVINGVLARKVPFLGTLTTLAPHSTEGGTCAGIADLCQIRPFLHPQLTHRMPAFYRLPSKLWRAQINLRGVRKSATFESKQAAAAWAAREEVSIMAGVRGEIPNLTVADLLKRYRETVSPEKKGARWEVIRLQAWERDRLASVRLRLLDAPHVAEWQERRLKAVSSATVRRERNLLNNVFELGRKEWRWLKVNPFLGVRRPKDGRARTRIASDEEIGKLMEKASPALGRAIVLALETGMRAGEIAGLTEVRGRVAYLLDTKNGEAREVPLSQKAVEAWNGGIGLSAGSISALFTRLCVEAGIEGLTFHDLRHSACTRLAGLLTLMQLCRMMGWKDPRHALIYYNETAANIAERL